MAMVEGVSRYGHVLRREDGLVLGVTLELEAESERKKGMSKRTWSK